MSEKERKQIAKAIRLQADHLESIGGGYYQVPELRKRGLRLIQVASGKRSVAARLLRGATNEKRADRDG